jgi:hypothetical protein
MVEDGWQEQDHVVMAESGKSEYRMPIRFSMNVVRLI